MGYVYNESIHQVVELCCELITLAHDAYSSESQGEESILTYTLISNCASRIQMAAENRRWALAQAQWDTENAIEIPTLRSMRQPLNHAKPYRESGRMPTGDLTSMRSIEIKTPVSECRGRRGP
jgi:hypothetical protein